MSDMTEVSVDNVAFEIVSGPAIPYEVVALADSNAVFIASYNEWRGKQRKSISIRCGRYLIIVSTDFQGGKIKGTEGILFSVRVRRKKSKRETIASLVVQLDADEIDESGDQDKKEEKKPVIDDAWRFRAS